MTTISEAYWRDGNRVPITTDGLVTVNTKTLAGNNTTVNVPVFTLSGVLEIRGLWAVVTTTLGSNLTATYFRLNDQTNQSNITLNTGTTISSAAAGSILVKKDLASAALTLLSASQERISEPTTLETTFFSPFVAVSLPSATTNIEFTYTTTNTPTSGVIQFFLRWLPISSAANVVTV